MTRIELNVILRKLSNIKKYLAQLQTKANLSRADYAEDFEQQLVVERLLHLLVESAADINSHIAVNSDQTPPDTYRDSFLLLGKMGVLSSDLAQQLAPVAGLRNRLVDDYDDIDNAIVYKSIAFALSLFPQYLQQVQAHLKKANGAEV
ncbi:MAG: DUF86 domain-containing protein [Cyanobacteria bacterium J06626_6]